MKAEPATLSPLWTIIGRLTLFTCLRRYDYRTVKLEPLKLFVINLYFWSRFGGIHVIV
ncbi:hypothetical protein RHECNPAF_430088 [Rhizobium etli CNPAF512]|nr:hypothetical protein RHECNPAF_430088 [Rhizobium etli CNPAF512]